MIAAGSGAVALDLRDDLRIEVSISQKKDHVITGVLGPEIQRQLNRVAQCEGEN